MSDRSNTTVTISYARKHIVRWILGNRRIVVGSTHGLAAALALSRSLTPPLDTREVLITQGNVIQWRKVLQE
jgi:hypothetical protein